MKKILTVLLLILMLVGCGSSKNSATTVANESVFYDNATSEEMIGGVDYKYGEKVIVNGNLSISTTDVGRSSALIKSLIDKYEAYIISSGESNYNYQYVNYEIRIPADKFNDFVEEVKNNDNVTSFNSYSNDVTDQYIDIEARLNNLISEESKLLELLDKAETVADTIAVESALSEVRSDIEYYQNSKKNYDTRIDYSTLSVYIESSNSVKTNSFLNRIKNAFSSMFGNFVNTLESLVIGLIYAIPFIVVALIVIFIIIKIRKKRKDK